MAHKLTPLATTSPFDCLGGNCPTLYSTEKDSIVVQGNVLDAETLAALGLSRSATAVEIPASLVSQLLTSRR